MTFFPFDLLFDDQKNVQVGSGFSRSVINWSPGSAPVIQDCGPGLKKYLKGRFSGFLRFYISTLLSRGNLSNSLSKMTEI